MKFKYCIIIVLLAFLLASIVVSCPSALAEIRYAREGHDRWEYQREVSRQDKLCFEELTEYCKEHEALYMEISKEVFNYLDEGLSIDEACTAMEEDADSEQKKILEQTSLGYPYEGNFEEFSGNAIYYNSYRGLNIKVVYIHEYSKEVEEHITSIIYTDTVKINDHLYVFYTQFPYD